MPSWLVTWYNRPPSVSSYHQNCPARVALFPRTVLWWNEELSHLTDSTRQLCKIKLKE
jgi:hypothetical protein